MGSAPVWNPADYQEPLVLVCLGAGVARAGQIWQPLPQRNVRLAMVTTAPRTGRGPEPGLARRVASAAAGRPYALLGHREAAATLLGVLPLLDTKPAPSRLIAVAAVPPAGHTPGQVPISAVCSARDPVAPPAVMAGWRKLSAASFSLQVLGDGPDPLVSEPVRLLESIQHDLRIPPASVPGRGLAWVAGS